MASPRPSPVALRRVSTVEAVVEALREQVLRGDLPGGSPLREPDLCEAFGVSRHTLRTALRALAHEGIVRLEPNRGAMVPSLTADDVEDLYRFRTVLEVAAARIVSGDPKRLAPVRAALRGLEALPMEARWEKVRDADLAFHQALIDAAASTRMSQTFRSLLSELRLTFVQLRFELEDHPAVARQHLKILSKLERGETGGAVALLTKHLDNARSDIGRAYEPAGR